MRCGEEGTDSWVPSLVVTGSSGLLLPLFDSDRTLQDSLLDRGLRVSTSHSYLPGPRTRDINTYRVFQSLPDHRGTL